MAVLSNLCLRVLLLACLLPPLFGCASGRATVHPSREAGAMHAARAADRRLVPPDLVWTLSDGARIPVRAWRPARAPVGAPVRAAILALHGFNDSRDAWELSGPALAGDGIALYGPDQRGFGAAPGRGTWAGTDRMVDDAAQMVRLVAAAEPGVPVFVMGESMGGAVALCLAARRDRPPVAGFVLLAPAVWSSGQMSPLMTASLWAAATFAPEWQLTGRELPIHIVASDNLLALYRLAYDPLTMRSTRAATLRGLVVLMTRAAASAPHVHGPVLIAYGAHDQLVPPAAMAATWALLPEQARRAFYPAGYHLLMRDRDRQAVIGDVAAWIASRDQALPSGADVAATAWMAGESWEDGVSPLLPANLDGLAGGGSAKP
jgi:alpha-beta hydrolase superfamily lysophospholipase